MFDATREQTRSSVVAAADTAAAAPAIDPSRFKLLKRPLDQNALTGGWDKATDPPRR